MLEISGVPLGHTVLKRRYVSASGWDIVSVSHQAVSLLKFFSFSIRVFDIYSSSSNSCKQVEYNHYMCK